MSLVPTIRKESVSVKKFIDFDKDNMIFYDNLYIDDYNMVIKMPLVGDEKIRQEIKINIFDIARYVYLLHYD